MANKDGIRSVAYTMLIAPMIEAFKELSYRITELFKASEGRSRDIASLKSKTIRLEAENAIKDKEIAKLKVRLDKIEQALIKSK